MPVRRAWNGDAEPLLRLILDEMGFYGAFLVNCLEFDDPRKGVHLGLAEENLRNMWTQQRATVLRKLVDTMRALESAHGDQTVAFYCRAGCHRSVSLSVMMDAVVKARGHETNIKDLSSFFWHSVKCQRAARRAKGRRADCEQCFGRPTTSYKALLAEIVSATLAQM